MQKVAPGVDQQTLQAEIPVQLQRLKDGDNGLLEEVLLSSILTLQALAANLVAQGSVQTDINRQQTLLHLGLKSQNQLRQTIATLNEVRRPRKAVFVKRQLNQSNFENSKKNDRMANELLAATNGSTTLDTSAANEAGGGDQGMATLATFERAENC